MTNDDLIALAREAATKAYAPYSNFHVGCAVLSVDGDVVTGANMENASYRLGICAEQSALTAAQHAFGLDKVAKIAVSGGPVRDGTIADTGVCTPCGGCRQAILEAAQLGGRSIEIICASAIGDARKQFGIDTLIPEGFGPESFR